MSRDGIQTDRIGFSGLLQLIFITLKLMNYITWSWFWVLAPTWITFGLAILAFIGLGILTLFSK